MSSLQGSELRKAYAATVAGLYEKHPDRVFALEADLASSMSTSGLKDIMGDHFVDVGIMEAHMVGTAAGINLAGGFAFAHTFGQFMTRRAMDQIFVSLAYARLSACLVGSDAGVTAEHNGGTHMTFEDMGIVRLIPGITVYDVCSPVQLAAVLEQAYEKGGLTYIRTQRKAAESEVYDEDTNWGTDGARVLRPGNDVTILACGIEVPEALVAADQLAVAGISAEVVDCFRIKPLDESAILDSVAKTGAVVTAENHNVQNGLGSAVAELLGEQLPTPLWRVGVREQFGQVGTTRYLMEQYGIDARGICEGVKRVMALKDRHSSNVN